MNQDFELRAFSPTFEEWQRLGAEFLQLPTRDFVEAPSLENIRLGVELIEKYTEPSTATDLDNNKANGQLSDTDLVPSSVYIHCKAGRTRSATLVACYLVKVSASCTIATQSANVLVQDMQCILCKPNCYCLLLAPQCDCRRGCPDDSIQASSHLLG